MKLLTSELKQFKANASPVRTKNTIPILSYLKFSKGAVTKNSLTEFIVQKISSTEDMLIDERLLMNFVDNTDAKEIEVTKDGKRILITDGSTKITSPTDDVLLYPKNDDPSEEEILLDEETLTAIGVASNFIIEERDMTARSLVFVGKGYVVGQNGIIGYAERVNKELPNICFYKEILNAIKRCREVKFSQNNSYYFFDCDGFKYGFSKPVLGFTDCTKIATADTSSLPSFTVGRNELRKFNDLCISSSLSMLKIASLELKDGLYLEMVDPDRELNISKTIEAKGTGGDKLNYNPEAMNVLLKNISDDTITFHQGDRHAYITGGSGFKSLISGLQ